jgi:hypothetical protein
MSLLSCTESYSTFSFNRRKIKEDRSKTTLLRHDTNSGHSGRWGGEGGPCRLTADGSEEAVLEEGAMTTRTITDIAKPIARSILVAITLLRNCPYLAHSRD